MDASPALNLKELEEQKIQLPRTLWLDVLFHKLTLDELEKFATDDTRRALVQAYYATCAALSPSEKTTDKLYQYHTLDESRFIFFREMIHQGKNFNPPDINLEDYRLIGVNGKKIIVFNPLLFLLTSENQALLNRIYRHALEHYKTPVSFGFQISRSIRDSLIKNGYKEEEKWKEILSHFIKAEWAISTYRSIEEVECHYTEMLKSLNKDRHSQLIRDINQKLLECACKTYNQTLVNHLAFHETHDVLSSAYEKDNQTLVSEMLQHGLNAKKAVVALPPAAIPQMKLLCIEAGVSAGVNALDFVDAQIPVSEKIVVHMLYRHIQNTPAAKAIKDKTTFFKLDGAHKTSMPGKIAELAKPFYSVGGL